MRGSVRPFVAMLLLPFSLLFLPSLLAVGDPGRSRRGGTRDLPRRSLSPSLADFSSLSLPGRGMAGVEGKRPGIRWPVAGASLAPSRCASWPGSPLPLLRDPSLLKEGGLWPPFNYFFVSFSFFLFLLFWIIIASHQ